MVALMLNIFSMKLAAVSRLKVVDLVITKPQRTRRRMRTCSSTSRMSCHTCISWRIQLMPDPSGPDADMVAKGKELCEDLVANVKEQYREFRARPRFHNSGGYGDHGRGSSHGGGNNNNSYSSYNRY